MSNVKIRDIRAIHTEPDSGMRFTVVKVETSEPGAFSVSDALL